MSLDNEVEFVVHEALYRQFTHPQADFKKQATLEENRSFKSEPTAINYFEERKKHYECEGYETLKDFYHFVHMRKVAPGMTFFDAYVYIENYRFRHIW